MRGKTHALGIHRLYLWRFVVFSSQEHLFLSGIPTETGSKSSFSLHSCISLRTKISGKCVQSLTCFLPKWINSSCMKLSYILMSPNFYAYLTTLNVNIFKVSLLIHGKKYTEELDEYLSPILKHWISYEYPGSLKSSFAICYLYCHSFSCDFFQLDWQRATQ